MRSHYEDDTPKATPGRKDTKRWCKGKVGREHKFQWQPYKGVTPQSSFLNDWEEFACIACGKIVDYRSPCNKCGSKDCRNSRCEPPRQPFQRQRKKYPHTPMGAPLNKGFGTAFREGTSYRRVR